MRSERAHDVTIQRIIQHIRISRRYQSFLIQKGILYKLAWRNDTTNELAYAPSKLVAELMAAFRDHLLHDHFSTGRT